MRKTYSVFYNTFYLPMHHHLPMQFKDLHDSFGVTPTRCNIKQNALQSRILILRLRIRLRAILAFAALGIAIIIIIAVDVIGLRLRNRHTLLAGREILFLFLFGRRRGAC